MLDLEFELTKAFKAGPVSVQQADQAQLDLVREHRRGVMRVRVLSGLYIAVFTIILIVSAVEFFRDQELWRQVLHATIFLGAIVVITGAKLWLWTSENKLRLEREIKSTAIWLACVLQQGRP